MENIEIEAAGWSPHTNTHTQKRKSDTRTYKSALGSNTIPIQFNYKLDAAIRGSLGTCCVISARGFGSRADFARVWLWRNDDNATAQSVEID